MCTSASTVILAAACAFVTFGLVVVLRPVLMRYALARPNARSSHKVPTPQGGGMAIIIATVAGVTTGLLVCGSLGAWRPILAVLGSALVLAILGAADDIFVLPALPRLVVQLTASVVVVAALDLRVLPDAIPLLVERVLLVLALVWFVNLVNFMDGIDWITVAEVVPICAGIAAIAALHEAPASSLVVAIALGGSTLGFAPFNRPVAKLFLGDVGSLPIGLLLGWQLVVLASSGHLIAALLLPLYYLADATITLGRRFAKRERVWEAHRTHYYQRATDRGFSVMDVVKRVFGINLVLGACAISSVVVSRLEWFALALGALSVGWLLRDFQRGRTE